MHLAVSVDARTAAAFVAGRLMAETLAESAAAASSPVGNYSAAAALAAAAPG